MNFDEIIDRRGTHSAKWDLMEPVYGVPADTGLAMWVADMDFRPPECVQRALQDFVDHGLYGYFGDDSVYRAAICWWLKERHKREVDPDHIFTTHGLVNATGLCIDAFTAPGDSIVLFTPVYHAFAKVIRAAGRNVVECELARESGRYVFDFDAYDAQMTGTERLVILCSPHNPGGRVWTHEELAEVAGFARRHDLVLVSDEIHCDLVYPGQRFTPMEAVDGSADRLVSMTATTKTFNIAGAHIGNVTITDPDLRALFAARIAALSIQPNSFGLHMVTAAYSPDGAEWVDALMRYLDGNRQVFDAGVNAIPGLASMPLEATYLSWVDFSGTGMGRAEFTRRTERDAGICVNHGTTFGKGGEDYLRFNIALPRAQVRDAVERLQRAFADLQ